MSAQKALRGSETETRELLGGAEENCVSPMRAGTSMSFHKKKTEIKIELVARPSLHPSNATCLFLLPSGMMDSATAAMISEGRNLADRLNAHFATTTSNSPVLPRLQSNNGSFYNPFFREVFEKKNEIEQV